MSDDNRNMEPELTEQESIRRRKLKRLQEAGRNPFLVETWNQTAFSEDIRENFPEYDGKEASIAGRMMAKEAW